EHNDTCMVCHHAQIDSCSKTCHTTKGSKEGENINLERAMHQRGLKASCIGCHDLNQGTPKCAACHALRSKEKEQEPSCNICHMGPLPEQAGPAKPRDEKKLAEMLLKTRKAGTGTYADEDIPEKVIIKELEDKYGPVELPHRKIVRTLLTNIKDNKLADYFHNKKYTICGSCHHNSPPSKKPPRCGSCHGAPFNEKDMFRPGIKGAFHQQCIGCHKTLDLEKPKSVKCIDCHKEKNAEG
ncbi:MAG: cytochrome C, partial [Deltaproteobacteria bacterium]|nr:cytochrome C [Deltaproteobacteria bacterium]